MTSKPFELHSTNLVLSVVKEISIIGASLVKNYVVHLVIPGVANRTCLHYKVQTWAQLFTLCIEVRLSDGKEMHP